MRDNMHDWVVANENMAKVHLAAKGYHYQFCLSPKKRPPHRRGCETTNPARSVGISVAGIQTRGEIIRSAAV